VTEAHDSTKCDCPNCQRYNEALSCLKASSLALEKAEAELREARERDQCDACAGTGKPISGLPCMCKGTGRMSVAALT
jgi:hypothetical protein